MIDQAGEGIDPERFGQRVWAWNAAWGRRDGTAAQYVTLPARLLLDRIAEAHELVESDKAVGNVVLSID